MMMGATLARTPVCAQRREKLLHSNFAAIERFQEVADRFRGENRARFAPIATIALACAHGEKTWRRSAPAEAARPRAGDVDPHREVAARRGAGAVPGVGRAHARRSG